jgi:hypothetical protein
MGTARRGLAGAGLQTAGLAFGGKTTDVVDNKQKNTTDLLGQLVEV